MENKKNSHVTAVNKYNRQKYDEIRAVIPAGEKEKIKQGATLSGESMTQYIVKAINQRRQQDGLEPIRTRIAE